MVRFKNRYILAELPKQHSIETITISTEPEPYNTPEQRALLHHIKSAAEEYHGQLFLAQIAFSLQIKYLSHGFAIIRVPRDHSQKLIGSLFTSDELRVRHVSGTIRSLQKELLKRLRQKLRRELS